MNRPKLKVRNWIWKDQQGNETPGVGLFRDGYLKGHYTIPEARLLADSLHDFCDANGDPVPQLPATEAEQE